MRGGIVYSIAEIFSGNRGVVRKVARRAISGRRVVEQFWRG